MLTKMLTKVAQLLMMTISDEYTSNVLYVIYGFSYYNIKICKNAKNANKSRKT